MFEHPGQVLISDVKKKCRCWKQKREATIGYVLTKKYDNKRNDNFAECR